MSDVTDRSDQTSAVSHISLMSDLLCQSDTRICAQFIHQAICPCMCVRCLMGSRDCPLPLPQDEELARQLQLELSAVSDVQQRGEEVTVPFHGDLQSILTVSHVKSDSIHITVSL